MPASRRVRGASLGSIAHNLGWMASGKLLSAVLSVAYLAIVTRSLGLDRFGKFALALGAGQAAAALVAFQSWQIVVRYGMPHFAAGRRDALARLFHFTLRLDILSALVGCVLVVILMPSLGYRFGWTDSFVWQAAVTGVVLVLSSQWTAIGILRLHDRYAIATACDAATPITRFVGALIAWQLHPTPLSFLIVWGVAEAVTAAAYWTAALRVSRGYWRLPHRFRWADVARENADIRNYAITTNLTSSLELGGRQVALLLVGVLVTPAAAAGFRIAQQLSQALTKISQMLAKTIFPELMRSRSGMGEGLSFELLMARVARTAAVGAAVVVVTLVVVGRPALSLIAGHEYLPAYPILLLLGTAGALDLAAVGFEPALVAMGRPGVAFRVRATATAILIAAMVLLTNLYGGIGAGVAVLLGSTISVWLLWRTVNSVAAQDRLRTNAPAE